MAVAVEKGNEIGRDGRKEEWAQVVESCWTVDMEVEEEERGGVGRRAPSFLALCWPSLPFFC